MDMERLSFAREENRSLVAKTIITITLWLTYVMLVGVFHVAYICLSFSIASLSLLMTEKSWTRISVCALALNLIAMVLSFRLLLI